MATVTKVHDAAACVFKSSKSSASVFEFGKYTVSAKTVETTCSESAPPKPLYIVTPEEKGTYPVLLLLHGFFLACSDYSCLLKQVASHGFIAVAPQGRKEEVELKFQMTTERDVSRRGCAYEDAFNGTSASESQQIFMALRASSAKGPSPSTRSSG